MLFGLAAFYLGQAVEKFARPVAIVVAIIAAAAIATTAVYLRRKERELAAAAERDIPGQLRSDGQAKSQ